MHPLLFQIPLGSTTVLLFGHAFSLGPLDVPAFGALLAAGLLLGAVVTLRLAERAGLERDAVLTVCLTAFFVGLIGARLGFVVLHPSLWESFGDAVSAQGGGLSSTFGVASGGAAAFAMARRRGLPVRTLFDVAAPGFALAVALGRLGCFLEGCDFGKALSPAAPHWLARIGTFPAQSPAWVAQVRSGWLAPTAPASLPVHPSELYECFAGLALLAFSLVLRRRSEAAGRVSFAVVLGYLVLRVLVDLSRPASSDAWCVRLVALLVLVLTVRSRSLRVRARHP